MGTTGRGLSLGDSLDKVKQIYGSRFYRYKEPDGRLMIQFQWKDETLLTTYLDSEGKVVEIRLLAPIE
jgi:mRNA-degrading endonuclease RelE of RelBE toxin-antitoxin system